MPSTHDPIKGIPLKDKPADTAKCGMSRATFAQHRTSKQWYELSIQGKIIGSPLEFDFYKQGIAPQKGRRARIQDKELNKV